MVMAEKTVEKQICQNCGIDVRPDTLFCYNCGSSVALKKSNGNKPDFATVRDKILEEERTENIYSDKNSAVSKTTSPGEKSSSEAKLKSAASLQRRNKSVSKKAVEVVWEEPRSAPNVWFLVVAFLLTIFTAAILAAMLYIR